MHKNYICVSWAYCRPVKLPIEDARTKRGSSHIGCKLRKMAKTLCPCLYFTHSYCVFQCLLHMLWTSVYYDGRNWSLVVETDTSSIFKILWLNFLLVLGSSICPFKLKFCMISFENIGSQTFTAPDFPFDQSAGSSCIVNIKFFLYKP